MCTGSALLAKTGMLKGHKATSNKNFSMAVDEDPGGLDRQGTLGRRWKIR